MTTPPQNAHLSTLLEQWRPIPGHAQYEISSRGRVRSWNTWLGSDDPMPRVMKVQERSGRRVLQLGRNTYVDIDDLMHEVWQAPIVPKAAPPTRIWRRIMLADRNHQQLCRLLESLQSPVARKLLNVVRAAKKVQWDDPISPEEFREEEDPCEL